MPSDWSRSWEVDRLVAGQMRFEGELALRDLPRIRDRLLPGLAEPVQARASVDFGRELGAPVARVAVESQVPLRCERCMGRLDWPVSARATLALVPSLADSDRVPAGFEPVLAAQGRVQPRELVEEELLLALPLIARHAAAHDCQGSAAGAAGGGPAEDEIRQKPFAGLEQLLRRR